MALPIKALILLVLLLYTPFSSGQGECFQDAMNPSYTLPKDSKIWKMKRKLLRVDTVLDYDDTGPNPKHDPRKGRPGVGGGSKGP